MHKQRQVFCPAAHTHGAETVLLLQQQISLMPEQMLFEHRVPQALLTNAQTGETWCEEQAHLQQPPQAGLSQYSTTFILLYPRQRRVNNSRNSFHATQWHIN